jgi:cyanate permease
VAIAAWFIIVDFPDKAQKKGFLSPADANYIEQRIEDDRQDAVPDQLTWSKFFTHLKDFKLWCFALMFMSTTMPAYALAYFAPVIILGMGYSTAVTQLLSAPPVVFAVISALSVSWLSDRYKVRSPAIVFQCLVGITGLMITAYHPKDGVRYFGLFLGQAGCQGNIPSILAYQSNNIRMQSKRAVGSALQIGFGAIGGTIASTVFREEDAPQYVPGLWVTTGLQFFILMLLACTTAYFWTMNKKVDNGTLRKPIEGREGFKYTL